MRTTVNTAKETALARNAQARAAIAMKVARAAQDNKAALAMVTKRNAEMCPKLSLFMCLVTRHRIDATTF